MNAKIIGECGPVQLEKRCYLPGVVLSAACPKCGNGAKRDMGDDYLSYPTTGEPKTIGLHCNFCQEEWEESVVLQITVSAVGEAMAAIDNERTAVADRFVRVATRRCANAVEAAILETAREFVEGK